MSFLMTVLDLIAFVMPSGTLYPNGRIALYGAFLLSMHSDINSHANWFTIHTSMKHLGAWKEKAPSEYGV